MLKAQLGERPEHVKSQFFFKNMLKAQPRDGAGHVKS